MSVKFATPGHLKIKIFQYKGHDVKILNMTSPTKLYPVIQIILQMQSCDQSFVTLASLCHFNVHEESCRAYFSKYCKSYFPTTRINGFTHIMSEAAVQSFPSCSCSEHFRKYWWKSPYVSNDCLWKLCLYLDFLADFLVDIYEIFNINNSSNLDY